MTIKKIHPILDKVIRFKSLNWKDGRFSIWKIPGTINQLYVTAYLQRLLENQYGIKKTSSIFYNMGKFQAQQGFKMISKAFGYEKKYDKKTLLKFNSGQSEIIGLGKFKWKKIDFFNDIYVLQGKSALAEEYKKFFGIQKNAIDYLMRGMATAFIEELTKKKMFTIETSCTAMGNNCCEFITKPIEKWNPKDPQTNSQYIENIPSFKELGAKIEPYIIAQKI